MAEAVPAPLGKSAWSREAKIALCVLSLITVLGVWLRSLGYFDGQNGLWWDEASWVRRILGGKYGIRPVGYGRLSRLFLQVELSEWVIRFPSYAAGVLSAPVAAWLFRRAGLSWAATCLGAFVFAVHPWAVAYAKEFKPYAFDLLFHAAVAGAGASYLSKPGPRRLVLLAALGLVAPLFSWTVAALYPALFFVVLRSQRARKARGELTAMAVMTALAVAGAAAIYVVRLSDRKLSAGYWGKKYGVFFEGGDADERLGWLARHTWDLARFPGRLESAFGSPAASELVFGTVLALLAAMGLLTIVRKRDWTGAALWVCPWLVVLCAHLVGVWPYGVFRTNLFFLLYPLGLTLVGFDEVMAQLQQRIASPRVRFIGPALVGATMLTFLPYVPSKFVIKPQESGALSTSTRRVLADLGAPKLPRGTRLVLDAHACAAWGHYTRRDPDHKELRKGVKRLKVTCLPARPKERDERLRRAVRKQDTWVYFANSRDPRAQLESLRQLCPVAESRFYPTGDLVAHCTAPPRKVSRDGGGAPKATITSDAAAAASAAASTLPAASAAPSASAPAVVGPTPAEPPGPRAVPPGSAPSGAAP